MEKNEKRKDYDVVGCCAKIITHNGGGYGKWANHPATMLITLFGHIVTLSYICRITNKTIL